MSTPTPDPNRNLCPDCGAVLEPGATLCWHCRRDLRIAGQPTADPRQENPYASPTEPRPPGQPASLQFSLAAALVVTAAAAVVLSVFVLLPGLGIALAILITPALVHTWMAAERQRAQGTPLSTQAKMRVFWITIGILLVTFLAAGISFSALCSISAFLGSALDPRGLNGVIAGALIGAGLGGVAGITVFILLIRKLWRRFF